MLLGLLIFINYHLPAQMLPPLHGDEDHELHFSHPLFTESPSPDTKIRVDYFYSKLNEDAIKQHSFRFEGEYAFLPQLSIEVDVPYTILNNEETVSRLDNVSVGFKYANFSLSHSGLLLGGGVEVGLPTGSDKTGIGSNTVWVVEPFVDFGYQKNNLEIVGFGNFGLPVNGGNDEANLEFEYNLSFLYHINAAIEPLIEINGVKVSGGAEDGFSSVNIAPGIKVKPVRHINLKIGFGYRFPLTDDKEITDGTVVSVFYHF